MMIIIIIISNIIIIGNIIIKRTISIKLYSINIYVHNFQRYMT